MELQGRNIRLGMQGSDVGLLQAELRQLGYNFDQDEQFAVFFDESTREAVVEFQSEYGMEPTGIVDRRTADVVNWAVGRLTQEEIQLEDGGGFTAGRDELLRIVSRVLTKAPAGVVEDLMANCVMLVPKLEERGLYLPAGLLRDKSAILLSETLLDLEWEEVEDTILHEVAHHVLRHSHPRLDPTLNYDAQEEEADALVERWLGEAEDTDNEGPGTDSASASSCPRASWASAPSASWWSGAPRAPNPGNGNAGACTLGKGAGMVEVGQYHWFHPGLKRERA